MVFEFIKFCSPIYSNQSALLANQMEVSIWNLIWVWKPSLASSFWQLIAWGLYPHDFSKVLKGIRTFMIWNIICSLAPPSTKQGCAFPMIIWPAFRLGKYRVNDHPYHAPQFIAMISKISKSLIAGFLMKTPLAILSVVNKEVIPPSPLEDY